MQVATSHHLQPLLASAGALKYTAQSGSVLPLVLLLFSICWVV